MPTNPTLKPLSMGQPMTYATEGARLYYGGQYHSLGKSHLLFIIYKDLYIFIYENATPQALRSDADDSDSGMEQHQENIMILTHCNYV